MAVNRQFYRQEDVVGQECFLCHNKLHRKDWDNELWSHLTNEVISLPQETRHLNLGKLYHRKCLRREQRELVFDADIDTDSSAIDSVDSSGSDFDNDSAAPAIVNLVSSKKRQRTSSKIKHVSVGVARKKRKIIPYDKLQRRDERARAIVENFRALLIELQTNYNIDEESLKELLVKKGLSKHVFSPSATFAICHGRISLLKHLRKIMYEFPSSISFATLKAVSDWQRKLRNENGFKIVIKTTKFECQRSLYLPTNILSSSIDLENDNLTTFLTYFVKCFVNYQIRPVILKATQEGTLFYFILTLIIIYILI